MRFEFFTDRDLGKRFPEILASAGLSVKRHDDLFPPNCADEQWLAQIGKVGWIAITHNARIRYMPNERDAVVRHGVSLLVVVGKAPLKDLAQNFCRNDAPYRDVPRKAPATVDRKGLSANAGRSGQALRRSRLCLALVPTIRHSASRSWRPLSCKVCNFQPALTHLRFGLLDSRKEPLSRRAAKPRRLSLPGSCEAD